MALKRDRGLEPTEGRCLVQCRTPLTGASQTRRVSALGCVSAMRRVALATSTTLDIFDFRIGRLRSTELTVVVSIAHHE